MADFFDGDRFRATGTHMGDSLIRHSRGACPRDSGERESMSRRAVGNCRLRRTVGIHSDLVCVGCAQRLGLLLLYDREQLEPGEIAVKG
jgi:hypothetical protein